ncbi:hypothetical protein QBC38DRAFT_258682 [Podospora fimiseda]|uniref:F-box domain-containing protein n=1 Tax=Podospora fimiseda TaxID=252190 RepID=A0AAN7BWU8_9PEZI|nr:hypothetical protein QBC38DRAFT_258682 [Podospora fimiseda]
MPSLPGPSLRYIPKPWRNVIKPRRPLPVKPALPSLINLPNEIIHAIIQILQDSSPETVGDIALACSHLYHLALYIRCRSLSVQVGTSAPFGHLQPKAISDRLNHILENDMLSVVRVLRVTIAAHYDIDVATVMSPLFRNIPSMHGLSDLYCNGLCMPESMVEHLKSCPRIRLHLNLEFKGTTRQSKIVQRLLRRLAETPLNLTSLRVDMPDMVHMMTKAESLADKHVKLGIQSLITSSPNLRSLKLCQRQAEQLLGYSGFGGGFEPNQHLLPPSPPLLERLEIVNYAWRFYQYLSRNFDWSRLLDLKVEVSPPAGPFDGLNGFRITGGAYEHRRAPLLTALAPYLTLLRSVVITTPKDRLTEELELMRSSLSECFGSLPSTTRLESISIPLLLQSNAKKPRNGLKKKPSHQNVAQDHDPFVFGNGHTATLTELNITSLRIEHSGL